MIELMKQGKTLAQAYYQALRFTGKVVVLIGLTLALGVGTWVASPIKFQADMGILLAFMFLWNMVGALVLLPALAHFLLPNPQPDNVLEMPKGEEAQKGALCAETQRS
jgi:predicted RND superfamily exporter protein